MTVNEVWAELEEKSRNSSSGFIARRVRPESKINLFVALERPSAARILMLKTAETPTASLEGGADSMGFTIRLATDPSDGKVALQLVLQSERYHDVFSSLTQDLVDHVSPLHREDEAIEAFLGRLKRWQAFLRKHGPEGLDAEKQRGLYGELWFLRHYLLPRCDAGRAIHAWVGPRSAPQDFQLSGLAIEVKTTTTKNHQRLHIASERQLDDAAVGTLMLLHLSVDVLNRAGETLPDLVDEIRQALSTGPASIVFDELLAEAGYMDVHRELYTQRGYHLRRCLCYQVADNFPRITEQDIRPGVGDVTYSVIVADCTRFLVDDATLGAEIEGCVNNGQ